MSTVNREGRVIASSAAPTSMKMIRIAIVDDHASVRAGLRGFLSSEQDIEIVGEAESGREAQELARSAGLDMMLLDISLPDRNGIDVLRFIQARDLPVKVLVISSFPEESYALLALRLGASGYLNKDCGAAELVSAVRTVYGGRKYIPAQVAELMAQAYVDQGMPKHQELTNRQMQVFLRLAIGEKPAEIASALSLSPQTISALAMRVRGVLGLQTNPELTAYAVKHRLIL